MFQHVADNCVQNFGYAGLATTYFFAFLFQAIQVNQNLLMITEVFAGVDAIQTPQQSTFFYKMLLTVPQAIRHCL